MESESTYYLRDLKILSLAQERRLFKSNSKLNRFMSSKERKRPVRNYTTYSKDVVEGGSPSPRVGHHLNERARDQAGEGRNSSDS